MKKPLRTRVGGIELYVNAENLAVMYNPGGTTTSISTPEQAKEIANWFQHYHDWREYQYIPKPGECYRYEGQPDVFMRSLVDDPRYVDYGSYAWTSIDMQTGEHVWCTSDNERRRIPVKKKFEDAE